MLNISYISTYTEAPLSCQHWVWEGWWSGTITKMVKGIASWEFPKELSLVEYNTESGTQKYSKCQTPDILYIYDILFLCRYNLLQFTPLLFIIWMFIWRQNAYLLERKSYYCVVGNAEYVRSLTFIREGLKKIIFIPFGSDPPPPKE